MMLAPLQRIWVGWLTLVANTIIIVQHPPLSTPPFHQACWVKHRGDWYPFKTCFLCFKGHSCTYGTESCRNMTNNLGTSRPYCCPNSISMDVTSFGEVIYRGCRCPGNTVPVIPPGAYTPPLTGDYNSSGKPRKINLYFLRTRVYFIRLCFYALFLWLWSSCKFSLLASFIIHRLCRAPPQACQSVLCTKVFCFAGEACLYNALCDDSPSLKCGSGRDNVFCCYNSRGIHTKYLDPLVVTACTCTNDFWGERCGPYQEPAPFTEQSEWCPAC